MPAIINSDDGVVSGSSGLKTSGANDGILALQNNGTTNVTVTAAGSVGIGTTSPPAKLNVVTSGGKSTIAIGDTAASTYSQLLMYGGSGKYNWSVGAQYNVDNAFEITPSTATGGTTFSTPSFVINSSGNVGIGTSSPITKLDVNGTSLFRNTQYTYQPAPTALTGNVTLTAAQILTGIITTTGGSATITMPTGSTLDSGLPSSFPNDGAFDFTIINTDSGQDSLAGNTGVTIVGSGAVGASSSGTFRLRKTGTATYVVYRLT